MWGSAESPWTVLVNGRKLAVTKNLWHFMDAARTVFTEQDIPFWIDAICINQKSIVERNHQVRLMRLIYSSADSVTIWLNNKSLNWSLWTNPSLDQSPERSDLSPGRFHPGPDVTSNYEQILKTFPLFKYYRPDDEAVSSISTHRRTADEEASIVSKWGTHEAVLTELRDEVVGMFDDPYFRRTWIIQEVLLAKEVFIMAGHSRVLFSEVYRAFNPTKAWRYNPSVWNSGMKDLISGFCRSRAALLARQRYSSIVSYSMADVLRIFGRTECSDIRDRVIGLLGLVDQGPADEAFDVDYTMDKHQLFEHFMKWCTSDPFSDAHILFQQLDLQIPTLLQSLQQRTVIEVRVTASKLPKCRNCSAHMNTAFVGGEWYNVRDSALVIATSAGGLSSSPVLICLKEHNIKSHLLFSSGGHFLGFACSIGDGLLECPSVEQLQMSICMSGTRIRHEDAPLALDCKALLYLLSRNASFWPSYISRCSSKNQQAGAVTNYRRENSKLLEVISGVETVEMSKEAVATMYADRGLTVSQLDT
ncbi:uncharacterized protein AB675_3545 [Cyphellophora attinorum]|uniref:Heterokaryon incompatibility domain-containing protein n=1 Tax=Cyphellophora attinorum TaxID=1664694 RepID=A0A0N1P058_9EURO|nr:uncharacterized protein AB675_3545 [Phialophora attinorum]KPI39840.1 hypothetical protein AB675_3545 [Phialophora attinorum]